MYPKKHNKYKNKKVMLDGVLFDSKKEMQRYLQLKMLVRIGEITQLEPHPKYLLHCNNVKVCSYTADFFYYDNKNSEFVVEDVKSPATKKLPLFRLKAKMMKAEYGIDILIT